MRWVSLVRTFLNVCCVRVRVHELIQLRQIVQLQRPPPRMCVRRLLYGSLPGVIAQPSMLLIGSTHRQDSQRILESLNSHRDDHRFPDFGSFC